MLVMMVSGILVAGGLIINEFETAYINTSISSVDPVNKNLTTQTVNTTELNETFSDLYGNLDDLKSSEGFLDVLLDGTTVLSTLFITFITSIPVFLGITQSQTTTLATFLGIPVVLIFFIMVTIMVWFIFKAVEQFRRYPA